MMNRLLLGIFVLGWIAPLWAQSGPVTDDPLYQWPKAETYFGTYDLPGLEPLSEVSSLLQAWGLPSRLTDQTVSLTGIHLRYEQLFEGYPVAYSEIKVNLDPQRNISSYFTSLAPTATWPAGLADDLAAIDSGQAVQQVLARFPGTVQEARKVFYYDWHTETPYAALHVHLNGENGVFYDILYHPQEGVLQKRDARHFFGRHQDTLVSMQVFRPDPLTTAQRNYGGLYQDFNDGDSPALNQERATVQARVRFDNGVFSLSGYNLEMKDLRTPNIAPPISLQPFFNFTRSEDGFEFVNAYYHLSQFHLYLIDLGFQQITSFVLEVDPHGTTEDNSFFATTNPPRIIFGTGGVDDAEDADVVVHEYGHAISFSVSPNTNNGFERRALDEGFGDYLAASYSREISEFRWGEVYTWDGHNEFWPGRTAANAKFYPDDLGSNFYLGGEIWAAALMEAWPLIGKDNMDRLVVQMMYSTASNITLREAAQLLLQAESQLYNGQYQEELYLILANRGLIESFETSIVGTNEFIRGVGRPTVYLASGIDKATVEAYNLQGQLMGQMELQTAVKTLPAAWFPVAGMYLIRLLLPDGQVAEKAVLAQP